MREAGQALGRKRLRASIQTLYELLRGLPELERKRCRTNRASIQELVTNRMWSFKALQIAFLVESYEAVSRCRLLDTEILRKLSCGHRSTGLQDQS